jgi:hypothetical protein
MPRRPSKAARLRRGRSANKLANALERRRRRGLSFEVLEDRRLLAAWDGGGNGTSWHDALNWVDDVLPATGEDIVIGEAFAGTTIQITQHVSVDELNSAASLALPSGTLSVQGLSLVSGALALTGGTLYVDGNLTLTGENLWTSGILAGNGALNIATEASLTLSGSSPKYLSLTLENSGE